MKCERYYRSFYRIKIHQALQCPAEKKQDIKNEIFPQESNLDNKCLGEGEPDDDKKEEKCLEEKDIKKEESFESSIVVKTEPGETSEDVEGDVFQGRINPYCSGVYRPAPVVTDSDSE